MIYYYEFSEADKAKSITISKRKDGKKDYEGNNQIRYSIRVKIGYEIKNGKKKYLYKNIYGYSEFDVRAAYCDFIDERIKLKQGLAENHEMLEFQMEDWLKNTKFYQGTLKQSSFDRFETTYYNQIKPYIGKMKHCKTREITGEDVSIVLRMICDKGYSHSTYKKAYYCFSNFFNSMIEERKILFSPVKKDMLIRESEYRQTFQRRVFRRRENLIDELKNNGNISKNEMRMLSENLHFEIDEDLLGMHPNTVKRDELTDTEIKYYKKVVRDTHTLDDESVRYLNKIFKSGFEEDDYFILFTQLDMKDKKKDDMVILTREEIDRIYDVIHNGYKIKRVSKNGNEYYIGSKKPLRIENAEMFAFMLNTGLRVGEVCGLKYSSIDFENKILTVEGSIKCIKKRDKNNNLISGVEYVEGTPKTEESSTPIFLNKTALDILIEKKKKEPEGYDGYIFYKIKDNKKTPMNVHDVSRRFETLLDKANVRKCGTHSLRHTFASILFEQSDNNMAYVSKRLRHAKVSTTADAYVHITNKKYMELDEMINI